MKNCKKERILLVLPEQLLELTDAAAKTLQISRLGFIRQAIARHLALFHQHDDRILRSLFERIPPAASRPAPRFARGSVPP